MFGKTYSLGIIRVVGTHSNSRPSEDSSSSMRSVQSLEHSSSSESRNASRTFQFSKPVEPKPGSSNKIDKLNLTIRLIREEDMMISGIVLGRGAQGVVRKGKYLNSIVAIKTIQTNGNDEKLILREIQLLDKIQHPNVVSILAVCPTVTQFHIVMEYFDSHSLGDIIFNRKTRSQYDMNMHNKHRIAYQICCALDFLHSRPSPIIHRDIKPANILVNTHFKTKLCDLGLGKCSGLEGSLQSTYGTVRGTIFYMAPELILYRRKATKYSDVWAFACTAVEIYNERQVWYIKPDSNIHTSLIDLFRRRVVPRISKKIPHYLYNLLQDCFSYYETKRPEINEFISLIEEIWNSE